MGEEATRSREGVEPMRSTADKADLVGYTRITEPVSPRQDVILKSMASNFDADADVVAFTDARGWVSLWRPAALVLGGDAYQRKVVKEERWRGQVTLKSTLKSTPPMGKRKAG